jgi:hypothetical protein
MLLSLVSPCRAALEPSGAVWISGPGGLVRIDADTGWKPEHATGGSVPSVIARIDGGISPGPWTVVAPGFMIDLPVGFVVIAGSATDPMPELHLRPDHLRGTRTIEDAFIGFERRDVDAFDANVTGPHEIDHYVLELASGARVRVWDYSYTVEGVGWFKRHYALAPRPGVTLMMAAQAPDAEIPRMMAAADAIAASFSAFG